MLVSGVVSLSRRRVTKLSVRAAGRGRFIASAAVPPRGGSCLSQARPGSVWRAGGCTRSGRYDLVGLDAAPVLSEPVNDRVGLTLVRFGADEAGDGAAREHCGALAFGEVVGLRAEGGPFGLEGADAGFTSTTRVTSLASGARFGLSALKGWSIHKVEQGPATSTFWGTEIWGL